MPPRRKRLSAVVKVQLPAGQATPAPPVGTALGPHGVNIMDFVKQYNAATESQRGNIIPVEISIYEDRSFTFITKTPPAPELIKKAAGVDKGSAEPHKTKVGSITTAQVRDIADQDAGPERHHDRGGREDHRRNGPLHGYQGRGLSQLTSGHAGTTPRRGWL
jgi:large subunit ribosomal protein L11